MDKIKEFYTLADKCCRFVSSNELTADLVPVLMELLMELYIAALKLPEAEPETIDNVSLSKTEIPVIRISEQIPAFYWEVFDPFAEETAVGANLADDLYDIAADLKNGMKEFEAGRTGNAAFEWRLGLNSHWGSHAVDALRALHAIRNR